MLWRPAGRHDRPLASTRPDAARARRPPSRPMSSLDRPPIMRRRSHAAMVGGIPIGGGAPIVVQSMTNTDTADIDATVDAGQAARRRRIRARAHRGERCRGRRRRAAHPRAARRDGLPRPADRRLPLQRPQAAHRLSRLREGAGQVPHQPGQRRPRQPARSAVRDDDRAGARVRQAGAHRRQLGQPRPGPARSA